MGLLRRLAEVSIVNEEPKLRRLQEAPPEPMLRRPTSNPQEISASEVLLLYDTRIIQSEDPNRCSIWCRKYEQWSFVGVCLHSMFYFSRSCGACRECLGIAKNHHWPEPFASIIRPDKSKRTKRRKRRRGKQTEAELKTIGPQEQEEEWENGESEPNEDE